MKGIPMGQCSWTLKRLGSCCKGCSCTKDQHGVIQCNVKEATSQEFQIWHFRTEILARPSHILSIAWILKLPNWQLSDTAFIYCNKRTRAFQSLFSLAGCVALKRTVCGEGFIVGSIYSSRFPTLALGHRLPILGCICEENQILSATFQLLSCRWIDGPCLNKMTSQSLCSGKK